MKNFKNEANEILTKGLRNLFLNGTEEEIGKICDALELSEYETALLLDFVNDDSDDDINASAIELLTEING